MYLFYKNIMHIFIINIILIGGVCANYMPDTNSLNVGSVLFNANNLNRSLWYKYEIELLKARQYFQSLIPAPHHIKTINEDCLNYVMDYFKDCYSTIKREAQSNHIENVMNIALSDVFGGYLKVWILPITKYAYYGGSVTMERAMSMFQVYEELKSNLNTDGFGWRSPNENLLRSVTIDVISRPRTTFTRSMGDPCKPLTFYEKTGSDFKIPMPIVNWNIQPPSLVLPFKNKSCVSLTSPDSFRVVLQYFDIAENCMKSQNIRMLEEFNQRFQIWLTSDVVPHLNDECLYIAFGNILSLVNKTKELGRKICTSCVNNYEHLKYKASVMTSHGQALLRKYFIIAIILLIEIIWCVPSLYYIMRYKREEKRSRFQRAKERFCRFFRRKPTYSLHHMSQYSYKNCETYGSGIKLFFKRSDKNLEGDAPFSYQNSDLSDTNEVHQRFVSNEKITLINEVPKKSSSKKQNKVACISVQDSINIGKFPKETHEVVTSTSCMKKQSEESKSSLVTQEISIPKNEETIKEINYSQVTSSTKTNSGLKCICCLNNENSSQNPERPCPCITCIEKKNEETKTVDKQIDTDKKLKPKHFRFRQSDNKKKSKPITTTLHSSQKSRLQTKIIRATKVSDGPHLHINVKKTTEETEKPIINEAAGSSKKPSKIPRLKIKSDYKETNQNIIKCEECFPKSQSLNVTSTMLRKNNLKISSKISDDSAIKRSSAIEKKLNASL